MVLLHHNISRLLRKLLWSWVGVDVNNVDTHLYRMLPHFQDVDTRMRVVKTRGLYILPHGRNTNLNNLEFRFVIQKNAYV